MISHCGEVDENGLFPRKEFIDLEEFTEPGTFAPITWEGCVVKLSDKIAYLGRDIEDALRLGFIEPSDLYGLDLDGAANTTSIMHGMITDVCSNSSPETGIRLSDESYARLCDVKSFNYEYIYKSARFGAFCRYSELILNEIFGTLYLMYDGCDTVARIRSNKTKYKKLTEGFIEWLSEYCTGLCASELYDAALYENEKCYGDLTDKKTYARAIIDFISGMTDRYAISLFDEFIKY